MALRLVPHKELVKASHEEYVRKYANVPQPKLINLDALITFTSPREFQWGGVGYRAPPLAFLTGARLMVAAHALKDLRESPLVLPPARVAAMRVAVSCIRPAIRGRRFKGGNPEEVEALCWWLLHVPDGGVSPPAEGPVTLDFMDTLAAFARDFPAWIHDRWSAMLSGKGHRNGMPLSWAHYQYGVRHMVRARHREDLRQAMAVRAAGTDKKDYKAWERDWRAAAGW